jgi:hypothetical protein
MEPLSLALSIVAVFSTCRDGYKLLCSIQSAGTNYSRTRCRFEIQQARFLMWGRSWGLGDYSKDTLLARLESEGPIASKLVENILREIAAIFSDGDKIKSNYDAKVEMNVSQQFT